MMILNNIILASLLIVAFLVFLKIKELSEPIMEEPYWQRHLKKNISTQEFYECIENLLKCRDIPGLKMCRVVRKEGGLLSANREYLRIRRKEIFIEVCGFVFGNGFYISCRKGSLPYAKKRTDQEKSICEDMFNPQTFYRTDTEKAFILFVNNSIDEAITIIDSGTVWRSDDISS